MLDLWKSWTLWNTAFNKWSEAQTERMKMIKRYETNGGDDSGEMEMT